MDEEGRKKKHELAEQEEQRNLRCERRAMTCAKRANNKGTRWSGCQPQNLASSSLNFFAESKRPLWYPEIFLRRRDISRKIVKRWSQLTGPTSS